MSFYKIIIVFIFFVSYEVIAVEDNYKSCLESRKKEINSSMEAGIVIWECKYENRKTKNPISPKEDNLRSPPKEKSEDLINL